MLKFGNVDLAKEDARAVWRWQGVERVLQDSRYAVRMLRKSPGFSTIAVLSVALGIAVNTTMFSVVNAVLLRTVPFPESERLLRLVQQHTGGDVTIPEYQLSRSSRPLSVVSSPPKRPVPAARKQSSSARVRGAPTSAPSGRRASDGTAMSRRRRAA
jgi:hypothetical protein